LVSAILASPGSFDRSAWLRLLAACAVSALLHLMVLGVPVNPTGGLPNVVSTIQARLEPAASDDATLSATPDEALPVTADVKVADGADKPAADKPPPAPAAKPAAAPASAPGTGIEVPLIRDPVYY
jgi:hypothetical protein